MFPPCPRAHGLGATSSLRFPQVSVGLSLADQVLPPCALSLRGLRLTGRRPGLPWPQPPLLRLQGASALGAGRMGMEGQSSPWLSVACPVSGCSWSTQPLRVGRVSPTIPGSGSAAARLVLGPAIPHAPVYEGGGRGLQGELQGELMVLSGDRPSPHYTPASEDRPSLAGSKGCDGGLQEPSGLRERGSPGRLGQMPAGSRAGWGPQSQDIGLTPKPLTGLMQGSL